MGGGGGYMMGWIGMKGWKNEETYEAMNKPIDEGMSEKRKQKKGINDPLDKGMDAPIDKGD